MNVIEERSLVTYSEAEKITGLSVRTIRRRVEDGTLTAYSVGPKLIRLDAAELEALPQPIPVKPVEPAEPVSLEDHIREMVAQAPPLSDAQRARITSIFQAGASA